MKVRFIPVTEHYATAAKRIQERKEISLSTWHTLIFYYAGAAVVFVPLIFLWFEHYVLAMIGGLFALALILSYPSLTQENQYVKFYQKILGDNPDLLEIELNESGLNMRCDKCSHTYKWTSFEHLEETENAIFFFTKDCGISVPKNAFGSSDEVQEFYNFAKTNIEAS